MRFVDRAKDIVIRGGMNIPAAEVEGLVSSHEAVAECGVVGYPDSDLRELEVGSYKLPERIEIIEALPRNPVGKITKPILREKWAE